MAEYSLARQTMSLGSHDAELQKLAAAWDSAENVAKLWNRDASLFSNADEAKWMAWLDIVDKQLADTTPLVKAAADAAHGNDGKPFAYCVVLGMGGSSLCPEVMARTFGRKEGAPELLVLDSTVPAQVKKLDALVPTAGAMFIVASKSGGTIEPNSFKQHFFDRTTQSLGLGGAGKHFVAITDPGTKMEQIAQGDKFRAVYYGLPQIGGRFSALSNFGMIPAASAGVDVVGFLEAARVMVRACGPDMKVKDNPGVLLGLALGSLAQSGRDKLTVIASPGIGTLGAWLEQLIAESTGKRGKGIVPVDGEKLAAPASYGDDRVFVYSRLESAPNAEQDAAVAALKAAGRPVVTIDVPTTMHLGQEFFRWEIATAVAGSVLEINPFDQPDVESAKIAARSLMEAYEKSGSLPSEEPILTAGDVKLFTDSVNAAALMQSAGDKASDAAAIVKAHLARIQPGDYFAVNAYIEMVDEHDEHLQAIRNAVRDKKLVATTVGYGPRFLHSTGQLHKGGPNSGVFLQITSDDASDLPIAGQKYTFGILKAAQAQGDFAVLAERDRRILRVHLGSDVVAGLRRLRHWIEGALA
ncbi:MAG: bifunctional transaldolase/phosoglucose isomerase [Planctomycetaceae bacterium]|nr:bifunctional transaldolase/phosoglucose isomerase [Planctomycetaceae bacterium]